MIKLSLDNIENWDLTWFAYDNHHHVRVFFSNGTKLVLVDNILENNNYIEAIDYFESLPDIGQCHGNKQNSTFQKSDNIYSDYVGDYLKKGLFVYDIDNIANAVYDLVASPDNPLLIDNIDMNIKNKIEKFDGFFSNHIEIKSI